MVEVMKDGKEEVVVGLHNRLGKVMEKLQAVRKGGGEVKVVEEMKDEKGEEQLHHTVYRERMWRS